MQGGAFKSIAQLHLGVIMLQNCNNQQWNHCDTEKKTEKRSDLKRIKTAQLHLGVIMLQVPWNTVALQNCETATGNSGTTVTQIIEQHH